MGKEKSIGVYPSQIVKSKLWEYLLVRSFFYKCLVFLISDSVGTPRQFYKDLNLKIKQ